MKQKNTPLIIAAVICVLSLAVMVFALSRTGTAVGEFVPPEFDPAAQSGTPSVPGGLGWSELDAQAFKVSVCGVVVPVENRAMVWLTNPAGNEVWLKLRILDEKGNILGESGLIRPGEYVEAVELTEVPKSGTPITLKLMAYEPETYYSAGAVTLNTTIGGAN